MTRKYTSISIATTLSATISSSATTITVASATDLLGDATLGGSDQFAVAIDPDTVNEEIIFVTAANTSTNVLTVTRGRAGTTAISHNSGATVKHVLTGEDLTYFETELGKTVNKTDIAAKGDLFVGTANDAYSILTAGTNERRLVADSAEATGLKYVADTTNYAVGAKGDLLVGTAADTVTNVAVGANNTVLTADSATASGVKWATISAATYTWSDYTPTLTQSGTVTATVNWAKYADVGNIRFIDVSLSVTGSGTGSNVITVSIPSSAVSTGAIVGSGYFYDASAPAYFTFVAETASSTTVKFLPSYAGTNTKDFLGAQTPFQMALASGDAIKFQAIVRI